MLPPTQKHPPCMTRLIREELIFPVASAVQSAQEIITMARTSSRCTDPRARRTKTLVSPGTSRQEAVCTTGSIPFRSYPEGTVTVLCERDVGGII